MVVVFDIFDIIGSECIKKVLIWRMYLSVICLLKFTGH